MNGRLRVLVLTLALAVLLPAGLTAQERALRAMEVHTVPEIGLKVWVEKDPLWEAALARRGTRVQYVVESPDHYHPPSALIYSLYKGVTGDYRGLRTLAETAVRTAAAGYGVQNSENLQVRAARYGVLNGYEADFTGRLDGEPVEVRLFIGGEKGKPLVTAQAITQPGKLVHLAEVLRRAWSNLSYL